MKESWADAQEDQLRDESIQGDSKTKLESRVQKTIGTTSRAREGCFGTAPPPFLPLSLRQAPSAPLGPALTVLPRALASSSRALRDRSAAARTASAGVCFGDVCTARTLDPRT